MLALQHVDRHPRQPFSYPIHASECLANHTPPVAYPANTKPRLILVQGTSGRFGKTQWREHAVCVFAFVPARGSFCPSSSFASSDAMRYSS